MERIMSNFTDEKILPALSFDERYNHPEGTYEGEVNLPYNSWIGIYTDYNSARLTLTFNHRRHTIGNVYYNLFNVPNCREIGMSFDSSFINVFDFGVIKTRIQNISAAETMEELLKYPDFREWLLWNQL